MKLKLVTSIFYHDVC